MTSRPVSHGAELERVYSEQMWSVYAELDRSLTPRSPDWLMEGAEHLLTPGSVVLDAGCRDAANAPSLATVRIRTIVERSTRSREAASAIVTS